MADKKPVADKNSTHAVTEPQRQAGELTLAADGGGPGHSAEEEARRWRRLRGRLEVPEWSPEMAACLLLGIDPESLRYSEQEGYFIEWLPGGLPQALAREVNHFDANAEDVDIDPDDIGIDSDSVVKGIDADAIRIGSSSAAYAFAQHIHSELTRMRRITSAADAATVRTSHDWLRWSVGANCEPPWLKAASACASFRRLLPHDLAAREDPPEGARPLVSEIGAMGGKRRHSKSPQGRAKKIVKLEYDKRLQDARADPIGFAKEMERMLRKDGEKAADPKKAPYAQPRTIQGWIRVWNREASPQV
jgi:hypothetical protein